MSQNKFQKQRALWVGSTLWLHCNGRTYTVKRGGPQTSLSGSKAVQANGVLTSPMPATVLELRAQANSQVKKGEVLAVLEAMKMEYSLSAPFSGKVHQVFVKPGQKVAFGEKIIEVWHGSTAD